MAAYRRYLTVQEPGRVVLDDVPFNVGEQVEVVIQAPERDAGAIRSELDDLLRATQALPAAQMVTEEQIAAELAAHRAGR